jgi:hypothetical protein
MSRVVGDATHIKGKPLSGDVSSGDVWQYNGAAYVPVEIVTEVFRDINVSGAVLEPEGPDDTLFLSGVSGISLTASEPLHGVDFVLFEVSGLTPDQIPSWSEISGMAAYSSGVSDTVPAVSGMASYASGIADSVPAVSGQASYASGVVADVAGLSGFVMASGDGLAVTVPVPVSGRVLKASGTNPLTDLYWGVDATDDLTSGSGAAYAYINVHGTVLDANTSDDTLNISGRSGILLTAVAQPSQSGDTVYVEVSGLTTDQVPGLTSISGNLTNVENSLVMIAWDVYSDDRLFSDVATDDFESTDGVDFDLTLAEYNASGDYFSPIEPEADSASIISVSGISGIIREDLKGEIARWYQDSGNYGHFEGAAQVLSGAAVELSGAGSVGMPCSGHGYVSGNTVQIRNTINYNGTYVLGDQSGGDANLFLISGSFIAEMFGDNDEARKRITVGPGADSPYVQSGLQVVFSDSAPIISHISGTGESDAAIELDTAHGTANVLGMHGLMYGFTDLLNTHVFFPDGTGNTSTIDLTDPPNDSYTNPFAVTKSSDFAGYEAWKAFDHSDCTSFASSGDLSGWLAVDFGSGSVEIVNKYRLRTGFDASCFPGGWTLQGSFAPSPGSGDWVDLDTRTGVSQPIGSGCYDGSGVLCSGSSASGCGYTPWYTFANGAFYRHYRLKFLGSHDPVWIEVGDVELVAAECIVPSGVFAGTFQSGLDWDARSWDVLRSVSPNTVEYQHSQLYHAFSFDGRASWKIYQSGEWKTIARLNSGSWEHLNASGVWQSSDRPSPVGALSEAMSITANQMTTTELSDVRSSEWSGSGGFESGVTQSLDVGFGLGSSGYFIPQVDQYTAAYEVGARDVILISTSWEASQNNPESAYCVLSIEPVDTVILDTDIKAFVSMNDGVDYEQITGLTVFREIGPYEYVRGDITGLTPRNDRAMRLKVTTHNGANVRIHAAALGVKYS